MEIESCMSDARRIIEVDRYWYAYLLEKLLPVERWRPNDGTLGVILFVMDFADGTTTELVFSPVAVEPRQINNDGAAA